MSCESNEYPSLITGHTFVNNEYSFHDDNPSRRFQPDKTYVPMRKLPESENSKPKYVSLQCINNSDRVLVAVHHDDVDDEEEQDQSEKELTLSDLLRARLHTIAECDEDSEVILNNLTTATNEDKLTSPSKCFSKTVGVYLMYLAMGFCASVIGPTLVDLEAFFQTDTGNISFALTGSGLGYLLGAILSGFAFDRLNNELQFAIAAFCSATSIAVAPFTGSVIGYITLIALQGLATGYMETGGNAYALSIWSHHTGRGPMLQALYLLWSLGSTLTPFILTPFLRIRENISDVNTSLASLNQSSDLFAEYSNDESGYSRFAFIIISAFMLACSVFFMLLFLMERPLVIKRPITDRIVRAPPEGKNEGGRPKGHKALSLFCVFVYCFLYYAMECTTGNFLAPFVVKHLKWKPHKAAILTALFWGSLGFGRLTNIPISSRLSPKQMLTHNTVITVLASFLFLLEPITHSAIVWVAVILIGYGLSSTFATTVLWVSQFFHVTGRVSSVLIVGGSLASMVLPPVVGHLFDTVYPLCLIYTLLALSISHGIVFILSFMVMTQTGWCSQSKL